MISTKMLMKVAKKVAREEARRARFDDKLAQMMRDVSGSYKERAPWGSKTRNGSKVVNPKKIKAAATARAALAKKHSDRKKQEQRLLKMKGSKVDIRGRVMSPKYLRMLRANAANARAAKAAKRKVENKQRGPGHWDKNRHWIPLKNHTPKLPKQKPRVSKPAPPQEPAAAKAD